MSKTQQLIDRLSMLAISTVAPVGDVGIDLKSLPGGLKPSTYLITAVVTVAPSNLICWGLVADGVSGDETDDQWGLFNDKRGSVVNGVIGTALAVGTHHIVVEDLGGFHKLFFTRSAGAVSVYVRPFQFGARGS